MMRDCSTQAKRSGWSRVIGSEPRVVIENLSDSLLSRLVLSAPLVPTLSAHCLSSLPHALTSVESWRAARLCGRSAAGE